MIKIEDVFIGQEVFSTEKEGKIIDLKLSDGTIVYAMVEGKDGIFELPISMLGSFTRKNKASGLIEHKELELSGI